jgi:hypothetical protein
VHYSLTLIIQDEISNEISQLQSLCVLHLNFSYAIDEESEEYDDVNIFNDQSSLIDVVEKCSPVLCQFGVNTRVWTVRPPTRPLSRDTYRPSGYRSTRFSTKDQAENGYEQLP